MPPPPLPLPDTSGFRHAFDLLDADRDGKVGLSDLKSILSSASDDDIGFMIAAADLDRNGFVEFEEFERVLLLAGNGRHHRPADGWMAEVFRAMDRDGDGHVGFEDLKAYLSDAGMAAEDEDVRAMIRVGGGGGEGGGVPLEGLVRILTVDLPRWI